MYDTLVLCRLVPGTRSKELTSMTHHHAHHGQKAAPEEIVLIMSRSLFHATFYARPATAATLASRSQATSPALPIPVRAARNPHPACFQVTVGLWPCRLEDGSNPQEESDSEPKPQPEPQMD